MATNIIEYITEYIRTQVSNYLNNDKLKTRLCFNGLPQFLIKELLENRTVINLFKEEKKYVYLLIEDNCETPCNVWYTPIHYDQLISLRNTSAGFILFKSSSNSNLQESLRQSVDILGVNLINGNTETPVKEWLNDQFINKLITNVLENNYNFTSDSSLKTYDNYNEAINIIKYCCENIEQSISDRHSRNTKLWELLESLYTFSPISDEPQVTEFLFRCGLPNQESKHLSYIKTKNILNEIGVCFGSGIAAGSEILSKNDNEKYDSKYSNEVKTFTDFLGQKTDSFFKLENYMGMLYNPKSSMDSNLKPDWWTILTMEVWESLLDTSKETDSLELICTNDLLNEYFSKKPYNSINIVLDKIQLDAKITSNTKTTSNITIKGFGKKYPQIFYFNAKNERVHLQPFTPDINDLRKSAYSITANTRDSIKTRIKVISLCNWEPAVVFIIPRTKSIPLPKKVNKKLSNWNYDISLEYTGSLQISLFVNSNLITSIEQISIRDINTSEQNNLDINESKLINKLSDFLYRINIDIERDSELCIKLSDKNHNIIQHTLNITVQDFESEGADNVLDLLIKKNNIESLNLNNKIPTLNFNRGTTLANLENYILNCAVSDLENLNRLSCYPIVCSDDLNDYPIPSLKQSESNNNHFTSYRFINNPLPDIGKMNIPPVFLSNRKKLFEHLLSEKSQYLEEIFLTKKDTIKKSDIEILVEEYIKSYKEWLDNSDYALYCDTVLLHSKASDINLDSKPYAILISPLHPIKLAWQFLAQQSLNDALESKPCPAGCILAPQKIPSFITLPLLIGSSRSYQHYVAMESNNDFWSVLWNTEKLSDTKVILNTSPLMDNRSGLTIRSLNGNFSDVQVKRALDDISELQIVKPELSIAISGGDGVNQSTNVGISDWLNKIFSEEKQGSNLAIINSNRKYSFFDFRNQESLISNPAIAIFSEESGQKVSWFTNTEEFNFNNDIDLGIMSQVSSQGWDLNSSSSQVRSVMSEDGLINYSIRSPYIGKVLKDSLNSDKCIDSKSYLQNLLTNTIKSYINKNTSEKNFFLNFSPDINEINDLFEKKNSKYVAISSSSFDPGCFSSSNLNNAYLWDYELPHYSMRAGEHNGYYLLTNASKIDRVSLFSSINNLLSTNGNNLLDKYENYETQLNNILFEISKRGIPKIRSISGYDSTSRGDLGLFIATRLIQDSFINERLRTSLLPIYEPDSNNNCYLNLIIPIDPFKDYIDDLEKSCKCENYRPDFITVCIHILDLQNLPKIDAIKITPFEAKFRTELLSADDERHAISQASSIYKLFEKIRDYYYSTQEKFGRHLTLWRNAYDNFIISLIKYGFRIYENLDFLEEVSSKWELIENKVTSFILSEPFNVQICKTGRIISIENIESDELNVNEIIIKLSKKSAAKILIGDPSSIYNELKSRLGDWNLKPVSDHQSQTSSDKIAKEKKNNDQSELATEEEINQSRKMVPQQGKENTITSQSLSGVMLDIGKDCNSFNTKNVYLNISNTQLNQLNMGIVGDLGTGKTQLLKSIVYQLAHCSQSNRGIQPNILLLDYKKDFSSPSSSNFIKSVNAKVLMPQNEPIPLNFFDISDEINQNDQLDSDRKITKLSMFLNEVLSKIDSSVGKVQQANLKLAISNAYKHSQKELQPTIYDVFEEYKNICSKPDTPYSILDDITSLHIFERDRSKIYSFKDLFHGVVVIDLSELETNIKNILIIIMLEFFYKNMIRQPKLPYFGDKPNQLRAIQSFFVVDEAKNLMKYQFDRLATVLTQDREFGTGVILASQYLSDFKQSQENYRQKLQTWFIHKNRGLTEKDLNNIGIIRGADKYAEQLNNLKDLTSLYKSIKEQPIHIRDNAFYQIICESQKE